MQNVSEKKNDYIVAAEKRKVWSKDILTKILEKIVKRVGCTSEGWKEEGQYVTRPTNEDIKIVKMHKSVETFQSAQSVQVGNTAAPNSFFMLL